MLVWIVFRNKRYALISWAFVFGYILFDDMFTLHERYGDKLSSFLSYKAVWGLRPEDMGEITFFLLFGIFFTVLLSLTYYFSHRDEFQKRINRVLAAILALLVLFGLFFDAIHSMSVKLSGLWGWPKIIRIITFFGLGIFEDGGEMIIMSFAVWYIFRLVNRINTSLKT